MDLNLKPVTVFEVKGAFIITLYPSLFKGFVPVLCGLGKKADVHVVHDCMFCKAYGHENCPYVKAGIKTFMIYKRQKFRSYTITRKQFWPRPDLMKQIPVPQPQKQEEKKNEKYSA